MKLIDVNILIYAVNPASRFHTRIRKWWEDLLEGSEPVGLPWLVVVGFLRISTNPRAFDRPLSLEQALDEVDGWLANPIVKLVRETDEHWSKLRQLVANVGTAANLTNDAHLAALANCYGATIVSSDTDFSRFRGLQWENPLDSH